MKLLALSEIIGLTGEKLNEKLAPSRAKAIKAKADLATAEVETQIVNKQQAIQEYVAKKDFDFNVLGDMLDDIELLEHRHTRLQDAVAQLFPETPTQAA